MMLGLCSFDSKIDMWSLGCILVESYTGRDFIEGIGDACVGGGRRGSHEITQKKHTLSNCACLSKFLVSGTSPLECVKSIHSKVK